MSPGMMYHIGRQHGKNDIVSELKDLFERKRMDKTLVDAIARQYGIRRPVRK